jgi:DNA transposition AAA+ family ATPase
MTATAMQWGPHFHGLEEVEGLSTVRTEHGDDIRVRLAESVRDRSMMLVTGVPGSGKSFAVGRAVEDITAAHPNLRAAWLELATSVRGRTLAQEMYPQIVGVNAPTNATLRDLRTSMTYHLCEEHRVLVLDEAQHVTTEAMQMLRWLYDRPAANFALVIVGTPTLATRIPPELVSRIVSTLHISRIADEDAPELLARYHELFVTAQPELLARLNRTEARGEFRWWAKFLLRAHRYLPALDGVLDADAADVICDQLHRGGTR